jgi:hypothetical protein
VAHLLDATLIQRLIGLNMIQEVSEMICPTFKTFWKEYKKYVSHYGAVFYYYNSNFLKKWHRTSIKKMAFKECSDLLTREFKKSHPAKLEMLMLELATY